MKKIDYAIAGLTGFFAGIFAIPVFYNIGIRSPLTLLALPWALAICTLAGMLVGGLLGRNYPSLLQFAKFVAVGVLNTAIDFGVLNIMSLITGVTGGLVVGGVNIPGVALALTNAYFFNKLWVFRGRDDPRGQSSGEASERILHDVPKFLLVSGTGIIINSGIVILATSYPVNSFNAKTWLNLAKVMATAFSLVWNFLGYKFIVFGPTESAPEEKNQRGPIAPL